MSDENKSLELVRAERATKIREQAQFGVANQNDWQIQQMTTKHQELVLGGNSRTALTRGLIRDRYEFDQLAMAMGQANLARAKEILFTLDPTNPFDYEFAQDLRVELRDSRIDVHALITTWMERGIAALNEDIRHGLIAPLEPEPEYVEATWRDMGEQKFVRRLPRGQ